jgi:hypothetical protein
VRVGAASFRIILIAVIATGALLVGIAPPALARQAEGGLAVTPPVSPVKPTPSDPWDLAPWTAVGLVAVACCALLAWRLTAGAADADADADAA